MFVLGMMLVPDLGGLVWRSPFEYEKFLSLLRRRGVSKDTVSEWLRRWTRNPLGSARRGSNPLGVVFFFFFEGTPF